MKRILVLLVSGVLLPFIAAKAQAQDVREGLVAYWPLDTVVDELTTPDAVSGLDMTLTGLSSANLTAGQMGMAMTFDGASQYLSHTTAPGADTGLPISQRPAFSVLLWVNGIGTGQNDRRVFSEGSSTDDNPLFNIGTHNAGTDNTVDIFIRNGGTQISHYHSVTEAYDGEWHHIAWTEVAGEASLYIDGILETNLSYTPGTLPTDITSIGAILRAAPAAWFGGTIDEVALWERELSQAEVQDVMNNGIATPVPAFPPFFVQDPQGDEDLLVGDSITLTSTAGGTRPFTYQWLKDGVEIPGETGPTLTLSDLQESDSGDYAVAVTNGEGSTTSGVATVVVSPLGEPDLALDLVSHWPLDEVHGTRTPDVVRGYDMNLNNMTADDLVAGQVNQAFSFENARQTLLSRVHLPEEDLPATKHDSFTISMWANVDGTNQNDLRLFSEGTTLNQDPLFNIGTRSGTATRDGRVDLFFRLAGTTAVNHLITTNNPLDGTWHHITFVQRDFERSIYIDGVLDEVQIPPHPSDVPWPNNNSTIGGILRAAPSHWVTGLIDEVAIWKRALTFEEVALLYAEGVPAVDPIPQPLAIRSFIADFPNVVRGDTVVLRWDVSRDTDVSLDQGIGDVSGNTDVGLGEIEVVVSDNTTYTLTASRGEESLTAQVTVRVIDGVAEGWHLLENFEPHPAGPIGSQGGWVNPSGVFNAMDLGLNQVLSYEGGDDLSALELRSRALLEGNSATLFFRLYVTPEFLTTPITLNVGLTEKAIRFVGDFTGEIGPYVRFEKIPELEGEQVIMVAPNGAGLVYAGEEDLLDHGNIYNFWLDIENDTIENGDLFSVYYQQEGDAERTLLFDQFRGDRNPAGSPELGVPRPDLLYLLVAAPGATQAIGNVLMDDFYLSDNGFLDTVPVTASSFEFVEVPDDIMITGFSHDAAAGEFTLSWSTTAGLTYSVLKKSSLNDAWVAIATDLMADSDTLDYTDTNADGETAFYLIEQ